MKPRTRQDYHSRIARVVAAMLADPAAPHSVESLAAVANLSPFHFHRIYRAMTGEGVAQTLRRVRLARAAHRLNSPDSAVMEAALDAGYDSAQAFARAFRSFTGVSPSGFQRDQALTLERGTAVEVVHLPPFEVLCLRHHGPVASIGQTYRRLYGLLASAAIDGALDSHIGRRIQTGQRTQIGMSRGNPEANNFFYLAGIAVDDDVACAPAPELQRRSVPGGLYASHRLVGPYALIAPAYLGIYGKWLPQSGYAFDDRFCLEFYRTPSEPPEGPDSITDILIPIRKP